MTGRGPDNEPLVACWRPFAWVDQTVVGKAIRLSDAMGADWARWSGDRACNARAPQQRAASRVSVEPFQCQGWPGKRVGITLEPVGHKPVGHEEVHMNETQLHELLFELLETELGGVLVYEAALRCVRNDDLRGEWEKCHNETKHHVEIAEEMIRGLGLDPSTETPGRRVLRHIGKSLVKPMDMARAEGKPEEAQIVTAECVTLAEVKDHLNWELLAEVAGHSNGNHKKLLQAAIEEVEGQEDEHLYHSTGWGRELWTDALGLSAVLPPPEERRDVKTAIGAARAKQAREAMTS